MKSSAAKDSMRNCFEFLGSMQMIRKLLLFAGIVKVTSRRFAASRDYGQRLVINWDVLLVPATRRVVIVTVGIISGGISADDSDRGGPALSPANGDIATTHAPPATSLLGND